MQQVRILIVFIVLMICTYEDYVHKQINLIIPISGVAIYFILFFEEIEFIELLMGSLPGIFLIILSSLNTGIGDGDGIIFIFLGIVAGIKVAFLSMLITFLISSLFAMIMLVTKRMQRRESFALVPFILTGATICILWQ